MLGIKIGDKHTYDDWGLKWESIKITLPEPKTYYVDVPGLNGNLDLSEVLTDEIKFNNRTISFTLNVDGKYQVWHSVIGKVASYLHGKKFKIILDTDLYYYYYGRVKLSTEKSNVANGTIVLECDVDPYKLETQEVIEDWLWDTFSFEDGVIREYKDIVVNGSTDMIDILDVRMPVIPTFICSAPMSVNWGQISKPLVAGTNKILEFKFRGDNHIWFTGNGTVSINFRGGSL